MSIILLTEHKENIFDIKKKSSEPVIKIPRYVSKFKDNVRETIKNNPKKKDHGTMGLAEESLPDPYNFLKKHTELKIKSKKSLQKQSKKETNYEYVTKEQIKAYNKKLEEQKQNRKNFVIGNIRNAVKMKPKEFRSDVPLMKTENFGKLPRYLQKGRNSRNKFESVSKDFVNFDGRCRQEYVTKEERQKLLDGLKENWEELQQQYQKLPLLTDTIAKIHRKLKLEKQLKELEKDIVLLERHPYIYVYSDDK